MRQFRALSSHKLRKMRLTYRAHYAHIASTGTAPPEMEDQMLSSQTPEDARHDRENREARKRFATVSTHLVRAPTSPRFRKLAGGAIIDTTTGICLTHVNVMQMDTATADRLSDVIIAALHETYGPKGGAA